MANINKTSIHKYRNQTPGFLGPISSRINNIAASFGAIWENIANGCNMALRYDI